MKCMCAQTRPRFILSSEGVFGGMEFEPMLTPREKSPPPKMSPEEDRTRDTVDSEPKHYQLSYSGPLNCWFNEPHTHHRPRWEQFVFSQANIGTVLSEALGRLLIDKAEDICDPPP